MSNPEATSTTDDSKLTGHGQRSGDRGGKAGAGRVLRLSLSQQADLSPGFLSCKLQRK